MFLPKLRILIIGLVLVLLNLMPVAATTLTVGSDSGNTSQTLTVLITVDNPEGIAGAAFTITYSSALTVTVSSDFFDTFYAQFDPLATTAAPDPDGGPYGTSEFAVLDEFGDPTGEVINIPAVVDTVDFYQPLITNVVTGGQLISAARCTPAPAGGPTVVFTLNVQLNGGQPEGIYPISITPTILDNTDAGYAEGGETIDLLIGSDPNEPVTSPAAFPVILDDADYALGVNVFAGQAEFIINDDIDGDGLPDSYESDGGCPSYNDADSDDDGILDGVEDANQNGVFEPGLGETDPCNSDTDGDGIQDGTELGIVDPVADPDGAGPLLGTDLGVFIPDADADATTTDPLDKDSDDDGFKDGAEDLNHNGQVDAGETDPNVASSKPSSRLIDWNGNLVADFGDRGMWYHDGTSWHWMTNKGHVAHMLVWDGKLVVDFGAGYTLEYYYEASWHWMTNKSDVAMMVAWNDGDTEKLVVDFGPGRGMYTYYNGAWHWLNNKDDVNDMIVWDNKLVVDWGDGRAMWNYDTSWHWMTNKDDVAKMVTWNDGFTEKLVVDRGLGGGIWYYDGAWNWLNNKDDVNDMTVWDNKLVVDWGDGRAMWNYDTSWHWMTNKDDVAKMVTWNDGFTEKLAVDRGSGRSIWYYDGAWNWMKNVDDVPEMIAWGNRLAIDFGSGIGIYNYNGAFNWMKSWSTRD